MNTKITILLPLIIGLSLFDVKSAETNCTVSELIIQTNLNGLMQSFAWSKPRDNVSTGVKISDFSDRQVTYSDVVVCLLNVGKTNTPWYAWYAPPDFKRVEWYLYDSLGKPVPYLTTYHPVDKKYKSLSEVPKNVNNVHVGHIWVRNDLPHPYDQITLTNVFQIERSGDYKLVVRARLMKTHDDLSLSTVILPPVSLMIHIQNGEIINKSN